MEPRPASPRTKIARALRRNQTQAEALLWSALRGRRLAGRKFHRQFAIDRYVVDFVCWNERLVIEIDGGQHGASDGREAERTKLLRAQGFTVLRFWNHEVLTNLPGVLTAIAGVVGTFVQPHPALSRAGEGKAQTLTPTLSRGEREKRSRRGEGEKLPRGEGGGRGSGSGEGERSER